MPEQKQNQRVKITKTPTAFIPNRLAVAGNPEYSHFPLNILFVSYRNLDGRLQSGAALSEPDFQTYQDKGHLSSMSYRNAYGGECYLRIDYEENNRLYRGDKFVNGKLVGSADGDDNWDCFSHASQCLDLPQVKNVSLSTWRTCWLAHLRKEGGNREFATFNDTTRLTLN